jgi:hypothetical protein
MQQAWLGIPLLLSSRAAEDAADAAAVAPASLAHYLITCSMTTTDGRVKVVAETFLLMFT